MRLRKRFLIAASLVALLAGSANAQTNPALHNLTSSNYTFTGFASGATTTYPTSMQGWSFGAELLAATLTGAPTADRVVVDSAGPLASGSIRNEVANGISLLNSGSNHIGAIAVGIDASGRQDIRVQYSVEDITSAASRVNGLRLQYRLSATGAFTDATPTTEYISNGAGLQALANFDVTLPAAVSGQATVYIRWVYYNVSGSGSRDRLRLDTVTISSTAIPPPDTTAPTGTLAASLTNVTTAGGTSYDFTVDYADNVLVNTTTIAANNVTISPAATIALQSKTPASGNAAAISATYRITPPGGTWDSGDNGTYTISKTSTGANAVQDTSTNGVATGTLGTFDVNIAAGDVTPPTVTSINRQSAENPTNDATVTYRVTFDEAINAATVQNADFTVTATGPTGASLNSVSTVNATTFDVTINTGTGDGTIRLDVLAAATIEDTAGNDIAANFTTGQTFTVDKTGPTVSVPDLDSASDSGSSSSDDITNDTTPTFTGTADSGVTVDILDGASVVGSGVATGGNYSITTSALTGGVKSISARSADALGNTTTSSAISVTIDTTAPAVSTRTPAASATVSALADVVVTFDEAVTSVAAANLTVNGSAATTITGSSPTFTFSGYTAPADGAVSIALAAGSIADIAGNAFAGDSWSYTKNSAIPTATITANFAGGSFVSNFSVNYTATFSEAVSGFVLGDVTASNVNLTSLSGGPTVYTFNGSAIADGAFTVSIAAGVAEATAAPAGRLNAVSNTYSLTSDETGPTVAFGPGELPFALFVGDTITLPFTATDSGSGIATLRLFARDIFELPFPPLTDTGLTPTGNVFTFPVPISSGWEFALVATDNAGNNSGPALFPDPQISRTINRIANGPMTFPVGVTSSFNVQVPMAPGITVEVTIPNTTTAGTLTVQRFEGNTAPTGYNPANLIDQSVQITKTGAQTFFDATVRVHYDEALLGGIAEADITKVLRDNGGIVTEITSITKDTTANFVQFATPGFSTFFFSNSSSDVDSWMLLNNE